MNDYSDDTTITVGDRMVASARLLAFAMFGLTLSAIMLLLALLFPANQYFFLASLLGILATLGVMLFIFYQMQMSHIGLVRQVEAYDDLHDKFIAFAESATKDIRRLEEATGLRAPEPDVDQPAEVGEENENG